MNFYKVKISTLKNTLVCMNVYVNTHTDTHTGIYTRKSWLWTTTTNDWEKKKRRPTFSSKLWLLKAKFLTSKLYLALIHKGKCKITNPALRKHTSCDLSHFG